jgi:hypothetical protein
MSLKKNQNTGFTYLKIKEGKFYMGDDKTHENPYDQLEGQVVNLSYKDENFNGQDVKKFQILVFDGDDKYMLSFPVESPAYSSFISFAKNVDLSEPITLHCLGKEVEDKSGKKGIRTSILISQNEKFAKAFYTKDHKNGLPDFKKLKISGKEVWDKTDYLDFLENVVENELKPQLPGFKNDAKVIFKEEESPKELEYIDDLPF